MLLSELPLEFTCHVCGEWRPNAKISVLVKPFERGVVRGAENIRYCNDRPECASGARFVSFFPKESGS